MTSAQVVNVNVISNSPSQDYTHPDDRTLLYDMTPGFKPFTMNYNVIETTSTEAFQAIWVEVQLIKKSNIICGAI